MKVCVIGAGITGSVIANQLVQAGIDVDVAEKHIHVGGLCHDEIYDDTPVSTYGPHIFHTDNEAVWNLVNGYADFKEIKHQVKALTDIGWVDWPINLNTLEQVFGDDAVAKMEKDTIWGQGIFGERETFESLACKSVGPRLYDLLIKHYTEKQWGMPAKEVPIEVFGRIPVRTSRDSNFFTDKFQGLPKRGYHGLIISMLKHPNIHLFNTVQVTQDDLSHMMKEYQYVVSTAPPDELLGFRFGRLDYRSIKFEDGSHTMPFPTPVVNFCNKAFPHTRGTDYGMLYGTKSYARMIECSGHGEPMYPIRTFKNLELASKYIMQLAGMGIISCGRLGGFKYLDMDDAISEACVIAGNVIDGGDMLA
jgi:UDP-galactopyranose mutase